MAKIGLIKPLISAVPLKIRKEIIGTIPTKNK